MPRSRLVFGRLKVFVLLEIVTGIPLGQKSLQPVESLTDLTCQSAQPSDHVRT